MKQRELSMLKAAIPFFSPTWQPLASAFACLMELRLLLQDNSLFANAFLTAPFSDPAKLLSAIAPHCTEPEKQMLSELESMRNMLSLLAWYQELQRSGPGDAGTGSSMDVLMQLLTPEQKDTFSMLKAMLDNE